MSVQQFSQRLYSAKFGKNYKKWFPRWIKRYARFCPHSGDQLVVTEELVIGFCRELLASRTPAWQRLQAVRAIEAYRNLVLGSKQPSLGQVRKKLERIAAQDHSEQLPGERHDEHALVGFADHQEPAILQQVRRELRLQHKALDTEKAYLNWLRRFAKFCGSDELGKFGGPEIRNFLSSLAVESNVAPSTQNQAKSALLFLYQKVLGQELEFLDVVPASKPEQLPVVLSRQEIACGPDKERRSTLAQTQLCNSFA